MCQNNEPQDPRGGGIWPLPGPRSDDSPQERRNWRDRVDRNGPPHHT